MLIDRPVKLPSMHQFAAEDLQFPKCSLRTRNLSPKHHITALRVGLLSIILKIVITVMHGIIAVSVDPFMECTVIFLFSPKLYTVDSSGCKTCKNIPEFPVMVYKKFYPLWERCCSVNAPPTSIDLKLSFSGDILNDILTARLKSMVTFLAPANT